MKRLILLLCLLTPFFARAENILIPLEQQGNSGLPVPAAGASQRTVLEEFGLPDEEHPPVGTPRMSRWDFRDFSVYFENERVITSVRHHQPRHLQPEPPQPMPTQDQP